MTEPVVGMRFGTNKNEEKEKRKWLI